MSMLKIYRPSADSDEPAPQQQDSPTPAAPEQDSDEPVIYSFAEWVERLRGDRHPVLDRSRSIHENRNCPQCGHLAVVPLLLNDGRMDASGQVVPATATLVGFHCDGCRHEWPAPSTTD